MHPAFKPRGEVAQAPIINPDWQLEVGSPGQHPTQECGSHQLGKASIPGSISPTCLLTCHLHMGTTRMMWSWALLCAAALVASCSDVGMLLLMLPQVRADFKTRTGAVGNHSKAKFAMDGCDHQYLLGLMGKTACATTPSCRHPGMPALAFGGAGWLA